MAWQEPKTDWVANPKSPMSEDFNRIESNIDFLKGDIETKKGAIVDALNTVGLASELTDTHATLASRITGANQGTKIITPGTTNQTIAKGFHSGQGYVKGDANLKAANIKKGVSIFGIAGSFASPIKSIQQGTVIGGSDPERRITINPVNVNSTIVLAEDGGYTGYNEDHRSDGIWLEDSNTLVVHNDYSKFTIGWKVIEFYPELVKSLQKGTASPAEDIPISPVNVSKSLAFAWGVYLFHSSSKLSHRGVVALLYSSYIKLVGGVSSCTWQVIEFY